MYEADHVVNIMQLARELQKEMARAYDPHRDTITAICQEIENSAHAIYKWANGIEESDHGKN